MAENEVRNGGNGGKKGEIGGKNRKMRQNGGK